MNASPDLIVAERDLFDAILSDLRNAMALEVTRDGNVTIDDIVNVIAIHRNAIDDRSTWWKIRRAVYARFASHQTISSRTLAAIPDQIRDELAALDDRDIASISCRWIEIDDSSPTDLDSAVPALKQLVDVCARATESQSSVLLRTNQPPNDFEHAFMQLDGKRLSSFQKAFGSWDESRRHEAHQRYNYYLKQGLEDCENRVLRDFSRPKTSRLNLKTDQRTIQRYINKCVKNYAKSLSPDLGDTNDPLTMISLLFDVEYEGYVDLIFDTRPHAGENFQFVEGTDHRLDLDHWHEGVERFACEGLELKMTLHDGGKAVIQPDTEGDQFDNFIGVMLRDTLISMRAEGVFSKLPLSDACEYCVGGTHSNYFWRSGDRDAQEQPVE